MKAERRKRWCKIVILQRQAHMSQNCCKIAILQRQIPPSCRTKLAFNAKHVGKFANLHNLQNVGLNPLARKKAESQNLVKAAGLKLQMQPSARNEGRTAQKLV